MRLSHELRGKKECTRWMGQWGKGKEDIVCSGNSMCRDEEQHSALGRAGGSVHLEHEMQGELQEMTGKEPPHEGSEMSC